MAYLAIYSSLLLMVFSPAMFRDVPEFEMPSVTASILEEIDKSVQTVNEEAAKFIPKVQELLERLNKSAVRGIADIDSSLNNSLASFNSDIVKLFANASATDVSRCNDFDTSTKSAALETIKNIESCVNGVMNEADERIALGLSTIDTELDSLAEIQKGTSTCTDNIKGTADNEPGESEVFKAYQCAKETKMRIDHLASIFPSVINFETVTVLYNGWSSQIGCCTSISEVESFKYHVDLLYAGIETCISESTGPS